MSCPRTRNLEIVWLATLAILVSLAEPMTATAQESDDPPVEEAAEPTEDEAAEPTEDEAAEPTEDEAAGPTEDEAAEPAGDEPEEPTGEEGIDEAAEPAEEEVAEPAEEEVVEPAEEEVVEEPVEAAPSDLEPSDLEPIDLESIVDEALSAEDGEARAWALRARTLEGGRSARQLLLDNRENADLLVRVFVGIGLIELDRREGPEVLANEIGSAGAASRQRILNRYVRHLPVDAQIDVLGRVLDASAEEATVRDVLTYVARHGSGELFSLFERLAEAGGSVRDVYVEVLSSSSRDAAARVAGELLGSSDASVREAAVVVAEAVGGEQGVAVLEAALGDAETNVATAAAFALAPLGVPASYDTLLDVARTGESDVRARALEAIRDGQPERLELAALQAMLDEATNDALRQRIYEAIGATRSDEAFNLLRGMLATDIYQQRLFAVAGLGYTGHEEAVPLLSGVLLGGGPAELRELAARGLGALELTSATESLLEALDRERGGTVKLAVIRALGKAGTDDAMWPLAFQLTNPDEEVVMTTLETLADLEASQVAAQVETVATSNRDPDVRWRATLVLFGLDPAAGQIRLQQALDRPPEGFMSDIDALPEGPRLEAYERLTRHSNPDYRAMALSRVLRLPDGGLDVLRGLTDATAPSDVRQVAVSELTAARDPADLELFLDMAESTSRVMRSQALEAVVELGTPEAEDLLRRLLDAQDLGRRVMAVYGLWKLGLGAE